MEHVRNLFKNSENLDVIVKGTVTGKSVNTQDEVLYQIETPCGDYFEANEKCVYHDVTKPEEVPQCVADWYEENKDNLDYNLWNFIMDWDEQESSEFKQWIDESKEAFKTIVNMHQFGYTVEKEKRYLVKMKGVTNQTRTLKRNIDVETWYFGNPTNYEDVNAHHTREELEDAGMVGTVAKLYISCMKGEKNE